MKRKVLISVLAVVLVLTLCIGVFVACNDDADKTPATKYTVTYALGEYKGTGTAPAAKEVEDSSKLTLPTATDMPAWANFTFDGWQAEGGSKLAPGAEVTVTANITYVAQWKYNFDLDDFAGTWETTGAAPITIEEDPSDNTIKAVVSDLPETGKQYAAFTPYFWELGGYTFEGNGDLDPETFLPTKVTYHIWLLDGGATLAMSELGDEAHYDEYTKPNRITLAPEYIGEFSNGLDPLDDGYEKASIESSAYISFTIIHNGDSHYITYTEGNEDGTTIEAAENGYILSGSYRTMGADGWETTAIVIHFYLDATNSNTLHYAIVTDGVDGTAKSLSRAVYPDSTYIGVWQDDDATYTATITAESISLKNETSGLTYSGNITGDAANGYNIAGRAYDFVAETYEYLTFSLKLTNDGLLLNAEGIDDLLLKAYQEPDYPTVFVTIFGETADDYLDSIQATHLEGWAYSLGDAGYYSLLELLGVEDDLAANQTLECFYFDPDTNEKGEPFDYDHFTIEEDQTDVFITISIKTITYPAAESIPADFIGEWSADNMYYGPCSVTITAQQIELDLMSGYIQGTYALAQICNNEGSLAVLDESSGWIFLTYNSEDHTLTITQYNDQTFSLSLTKPATQYTVTVKGANDYQKEVKVNEGEFFTLPDDFPMTKAYADPNPDGYTLSFHYFNDAEGHQFDYTTTAITGNITLTAVYEIKIAYDLNGATGDLPEVKWFAATSRQYYTGFDGNCTLPTLEDLNASYEGYRFIGWMRSDTNELLTGLPGSPYYGMLVDHDITFVAQWKIIKDSYTITYKTEGSEFTTQTINHGEKATAPTPAPTYNADQSLYFAFWAIEGTTDAFDFDTEIMEDYTLEAIFRHYFSFDIGDGAQGDAPAPQVMGSTRGDYTMPDSTGFSYEGKKLVGWTIQGDDTGKVYRIGEHDSYGNGQENVTFVAKWMDDAAQYTITYKAGDHATGADIITQHEPYSEVQIAESTFTGAQNYPYFKYWEVDGDEDTHKNPGDKVILTGNLTLKAVYSSELIITSGLNTLKLDLATNTGTFASYPLTFTIGADNKLDLTIDFSSADTQYCNKATGTIDIAAKQINIVIFYDYAACEYGTAKATLTTPLNGYYTSGDTELKFAFLSDGTMYAGSNTACKYYQVDANNYIADYRWMEGWSYKHYYLTIAKSSDDGSLQIDVKDDASNSGKYTLDTTTEIKAGVYTYYTKNYTLTITAGRNFTFSDGASTTFTGTYMPLYEGFYYATSGSDYFKLELQSGGGYKCTESSNSTFSSYTYEAPIELNEGEVTYLGNVSWKNGSGMFAVTYTISKLVIDPTKEVTTCVLGYTADSKYSYKRIDIEKSNYAANFDGEYADHEIAYYYSYDGTPSFVIAIYDDGTVMIGNSNDEYQGKLHKEGEEEEVQYVTVTIMPGAHGFSLYQETVTLTQGSHKVSEIVDALKAKGDDSLPKGINKFWYFNSRFKVGTDEGSTLYTSDDYNFTTNVALFAQFSDSSWYLGVTSAGTYPQFYAQSGFGNDSGTINFYINESDEGRGGTTFNYTYDMITDTITLTNGDDTFKGTFGEITVTSQHFCALNITITVKGQEYKFGTGSPEEQSAQPIPDGVFVLSDNHSYTLTISNWTITFAGAESEVTFTYEYSEHFSYGGDKYVGTGDYSDWEISYLSEDYISIWGATPDSYNGGYEPKPEMVHITLKAGEGAVGVDQTIEVEAGLGKAIANTYFTAKNQYWSNFRGWDKTSTATEDVAYPGLDDIEYYEGLVLYAVYSDEWAAYNEDYYYISVRLDHTTGTATFADFSEELSVNGEYTLDQTEQTISLTLDGKIFSGTWTFEDGEYGKEFTINITIEYEGSNYTFGSGSDGTGGGTEEIPSGDVTFECDLTINILANSYKLTKIVIRIDGIATSCTVTVDGKDISWTSDNINFYQEEDIEYTEYAGNGDVKYAYFTTIESQNFSAIYIYVLADGTIDISKADDGTPINESPLTYTKA